MPGSYPGGLVEVGAFDDVVAADLLLDLDWLRIAPRSATEVVGERPVGHRHIAGPHAYRGRVGHRPQPGTALAHPAPGHVRDPTSRARSGPRPPARDRVPPTRGGSGSACTSRTLLNSPRPAGPHPEPCSQAPA